MSYCYHCGKEIEEGASVCPNCGFAVKEAKKTTDKSYVAIKIFMLIGCVFGAFCYLIPLCWCIPMTVVFFKRVKSGTPCGLAFKICTLLFVNLIAGILLLVDEDI